MKGLTPWFCSSNISKKGFSQPHGGESLVAVWEEDMVTGQNSTLMGAERQAKMWEKLTWMLFARMYTLVMSGCSAVQSCLAHFTSFFFQS